ncbi:MAG: hypothetical protein QW175_05730 [Candidatus Bathyarchaeia archaeon]
MASTEITEVTLPSEVDQGVEVNFDVSVKLLESVNWTNLSIALEYTDGSSPSILVFLLTTYYEISKGEQAVISLPLPSVGETITVPCRITFPNSDRHRLTVKSGHVDGAFIQDTARGVDVNVLGALPPAAPTYAETTYSLISSLMTVVIMFMIISVIKELTPD